MLPPPVPRFAPPAADKPVKLEDGDSAFPPPPAKRPADLAPLPADKKPRVEQPTHAILCIDQSGSMRTKDVQPEVKGDAKKSRWDAVFDCAVDFVRDQAKADGEGSTPVVFSLVLFADQGSVVFVRQPLREAEAKLESARRAHKPGGGTSFAAAFENARKVGLPSSGGTLCLFLSDGRPGDLNFPPPPDGTPIQTTFKRSGKKYDSAARHLQGFCSDHHGRLTLHYVAIHADGHAWLRKLARCHGGTFHDAKLSLDQEDDERQIVALPPPAADDDDEVQIVAVKSAEEVMRERQAAAAAAGQVITVGSTVRSSMRSTFRSISSSLTSMRSSVAEGGPTKERAVTFESAGGSPSHQTMHMATRMCLDAAQSKFEVPKNERPNERRVTISTQPFAQGGLRNVYAMVELGGLRLRQLVAKESRHVVSYKERLAFHRETSVCQARAAELARAFNAAGAACGQLPHIQFLRADVYRLKDESEGGGYRYLAVEERLEGKYEKFNSNNGFVLRSEGDGSSSDEQRVNVPQAFSHFTYEKTGGAEMVVDIQGSGFRYTDPQLHSQDTRYGRADRGAKGFADFFASHRCNSCCRALSLPLRNGLCSALVVAQDIHNEE